MAAEQASGQAAAAPATAADGAPTVMAVWVQKEVNFPYKGLTSYYTCDGIRDKVRGILKYIGARPGLQGKGQVLRQRHRRPTATWAASSPCHGCTSRRRCRNRSRPSCSRNSRSLIRRPSSSPARRASRRRQPRRPRSSRRSGGACNSWASRSARSSRATASWWTRWPRSAFAQLGARVIEDLTACVPRQVNPGSIRLTLEVLQPVPEK